MEGGGPQDLIGPVEQAMRARLEAADAPPFLPTDFRSKQFLIVVTMSFFMKGGRPPPLSCYPLSFPPLST